MTLEFHERILKYDVSSNYDVHFYKNIAGKKYEPYTQIPQKILKYFHKH